MLLAVLHQLLLLLSAPLHQPLVLLAVLHQLLVRLSAPLHLHQLLVLLSAPRSYLVELVSTSESESDSKRLKSDSGVSVIA